MPNINDYAESVGFGTGSDRTTFDQYGQMRRQGAATQFDDLEGSITGLKMNTNLGAVDFDWNENCFVFEGGGSITNANDRLIWNIQKLHKIKIDSNLHYHLHYRQPDDVVRTFTLQYRLQENGDATTTAWTTVNITTIPANHVFPYTSGEMNQILLVPAIDWSSLNISGIVNFRLTRTDSDNTDIKVLYIDGHVEIDSDGSNTEYTK